MSMSSTPQTILVTGATGYIGGRLVPRLLEADYRVRCLVRSPEKLSCRSWRDHPQLTIIPGSIRDDKALEESLEGCQAAYYLVHSMEAAGAEYAKRDRELASLFSRAAENSGLQHIIYLGGLGELGDGLSEHLHSRREVEQILKESRVPITAFRAAVIIGAGSASFEILRYLVQRLPVMVTPKWVNTETQPIAVENVLDYLVRCLDVPETRGEVLDIGGADVLRYEELMRIMAHELGLRERLIIPVPVLTPRLSSLWIGLVTPVSSRIARPLAEGLKNRTVCRDDRANQLMPLEKIYSVTEAIHNALYNLNEGEIETNWSMAGKIPGDPDWAGGTVFRDARSTEVEADAETLFRVVCSIGGEHGYWGSDFLWQLRGLMDQMIGGPGLRRGRRHPTDLRFGEAVDFWRVRRIRPNRQLTLHAEMWVPGDAELDFIIEPVGDSRSRVSQTARFRPRGLTGIVYWYSVFMLHNLVFQSMLNGIRKEAEKVSQEKSTAA